MYRLKCTNRVKLFENLKTKVYFSPSKCKRYDLPPNTISAFSNAVPVAPPGLPGWPSEALRRRWIFPALGETSLKFKDFYPCLYFIHQSRTWRFRGRIWILPHLNWWRDRNVPSESICDRRIGNSLGRIGRESGCKATHFDPKFRSYIRCHKIDKDDRFFCKSNLFWETDLQQKIHGRFLRKGTCDVTSRFVGEMHKQWRHFIVLAKWM